MITYGLVKQVGPYSKGEKSSFSPYARHIKYISPKYPVQLSMGYPAASSYALRQVSEAEGLPGGRHPKLNRPNEWLDLLRKISDNVMFSGGLRATMAENTDSPDTDSPNTEPPDTPIVPLSTMMNAEGGEPIQPIYEGMEDGETSQILEASRVDRILPLFQMGIQTLSNNQLGNYIARSLPIVSYLVDTQRLTVDAGLTLLFGRYANPVIEAMRQSSELRRRVTDALSNYVATPVAQAIRDALVGEQTPTPRYIDYLGDLLGQAGRDAIDAWGIQGTGTPAIAPILAPSVQRGGTSLLRFIMRVLEFQGTMQPQEVVDIARNIVPAIQGAPGVGLQYLLRNTEARRFGPGYYTPAQQAAQAAQRAAEAAGRVLRRRTALG